MLRPTPEQIEGAMRRYPEGPMATRIGSDAVRLYRAEDKLHDAIQVCATERMKHMSKELKEPEFFAHGLPQVLYDLFENYDEAAVRKAINAWLEDNPEVRDDVG